MIKGPRPRSADDVFLATDPDRESEAIAASGRLLKLPDAKRRAHEIARRPLSSERRPYKIDMDRVNAQQAHRIWTPAATDLVAVGEDPAASRPRAVGRGQADRRSRARDQGVRPRDVDHGPARDRCDAAIVLRPT